MTAISPEERQRASGSPRKWPFFEDGVPTARGRGAVATTDEAATAVAISTLERGGSAVDAAVAATFALSVVNPEAGGIGGRGYLLVRTPTGAIHSLDFRSTAPRDAGSALLSSFRESLAHHRPHIVIARQRQDRDLRAEQGCHSVVRCFARVFAQVAGQEQQVRAPRLRLLPHPRQVLVRILTPVRRCGIFRQMAVAKLGDFQDGFTHFGHADLEAITGFQNE
jgi:hypothetical protein